MEEIPCIVQSPVSLSVNTYSDGRSSYGRGSTTTAFSTSDHGHHAPCSGCQVVDVELHQPFSQISIIRFRNQYTYAITILFQSSVAPETSLLTQVHTKATAQALNMFQSHGSGCGEWKVGVTKHIIMPSCHCDSPDAQKWVELGQSAFQGKLEDVVRLRLILRQPSPHWRQFGIENFSCFHHNSNAAGRNQMERLLEVGRRAQSEEERRDSLRSRHLLNGSQSYEVNLLS